MTMVNYSMALCSNLIALVREEMAGDIVPNTVVN